MSLGFHSHNVGYYMSVSRELSPQITGIRGKGGGLAYTITYYHTHFSYDNCWQPATTPLPLRTLGFAYAGWAPAAR